MITAGLALGGAIALLTVVAVTATRAAIRLRRQVDKLERQLARARRGAAPEPEPEELSASEPLGQNTLPAATLRPVPPPARPPASVPLRVMQTDAPITQVNVTDIPTSGGIELPWLDEPEPVDATRPIRKVIRADTLTRRLRAEQRRTR